MPMSTNQNHGSSFLRQIVLAAMICVALATSAYAQNKIDDTDAPVAPIAIKGKDSKGSAKSSAPPAGGRTVVTTSGAAASLGAAAGAGNPTATGGQHSKQDLKSELPAAVEPTRGVLRRPIATGAGSAASSSAKTNMDYTNPATPQSASMPGLGYAPGSIEPGRPLILHTTNGVNEIVNVSGQFTNRIVTPFEFPKVLALDDFDATVVGNAVYVTIDDEEKRSFYIIDKTGKSSAAVSLTVVPQAIPPQTIMVQMEGVDRPTRGEAGGTTNKENSYEFGLRNIMRIVATGVTPPGYTEESLSVGVAISNGVQARPSKRFVGSEHNIYKYKLENTSRTVVTLSEEAFAAKGVRAVAFFPKITLSPGEKTDAIILLDKEQGQ